ncbi:hypothetical protein EX30DRAFT_341355 [Ascodesmis nigricans]|uniref:Malate dehydrogenase n=1 Tax=Ascodesmis nigricans TaxID=341454 RepID=A0A4S2MVS1_9PEZI|nr:hypothetical protein EX30DRAFT_341355 [Ascodesmis nigricans]
MRCFGSSCTVAAALYLSISSALCLPKGYLKPSSSQTSNTNTNIFKALESFSGKLNLPTCKLERKSTTMPMPEGGYSTAFSQPEANLDISGVYFGHGTQNYTCASSTSSSLPQPNGAIATLIDISCLLKHNADAAHKLPRQFMSSKGHGELMNSLINVFAVAGDHYFPDATTPVFDFYKDETKRFVGKKKENVACPKTDIIGDHGTVDWLNLDATELAKGFKRAYRVVTAGGKPPATCEGMAETFEVHYATEYWFWSEKKDIN